MATPPLPVRNGVGPTRLRIPAGTNTTVVDFLRTRFPHLADDSITQRINDHEIVANDGSIITAATPAADHEFIWYYRTVPNETPIPFDLDVLHADDDLVVADKPHFLPTTPGGQFLQETALVRLRNQLNIPDLVPLHRLDRATAGVLLFSPDPATRGAYQQLFEHRKVTRYYQAVVHVPSPTQLYLLSPTQLEALRQEVDMTFWETLEDGRAVMRLAADWATKEEDVDRLLEAFRRCADLR